MGESPLKAYPRSGAWSTHATNQTIRRRELREAMDGKTTLISPSDFLKEFVPASQELMPAAFPTILGAVPHTTNELHMYSPLVSALNGDKTLPIEVKSTKIKDPYNDEHKDGTSDTAEGRETLGQIMAYVKSTFDHQHLMFLFMVLIIEEDARILRVDRSGIFVTKKFNYKTDGAPLIEFFWRFARLSPEERGVDPTAERIERESDVARNVRAEIRHDPQDYVQNLFHQSVKDPNWPLWTLALTDERTGELRRYLVGRPHFKAEGVVGRATRGYIARDLDHPDKPPVYLKDAWRVVHEEIQKEGAVLDTLNKNNVLHVPTLLCHGDLAQTTKSQDLWYKYHPNVSTDAPSPLKKHEHYRLVVKEVGRPLADFRRGYELVFAIFCCLQGESSVLIFSRSHALAYDLGIIHRDISAGNILLYGKTGDDLWSGMLNDWELSKDVNSKSPVARQPDRTGTWQFMSAHALNTPEKPIIITDELESFFHVLLYASVRFLPHNCTKQFVGKFLFDYFDDFDITTAGRACGTRKYFSVTTGVVTFLQEPGVATKLRFTWDETDKILGHPINGMFAAILGWLKAHYAVLDAAKNPNERGAAVASKNVNALSSNQGAPNLGWVGRALQPIHKTTRMTKTDVEDVDREIAENLLNHDAMAALFMEYLDLKSGKHAWPMHDKVEDQRPKKGYKPGDDIPCLPAAFLNPPTKREAGEIDELDLPSIPKHQRVDGDDSE
ncbi:hypothetical protein BC628DRAFT_1455672 [Trametes gibbosa]|nr:hypothetical protein BC628DRAFT_1455672 [Trametes gibbosa]